MKSEFLQPRFDGPRFAQHTLPVEVARDLAAYEDLVRELAKQLYLREHPGRQRVPKGFADQFSLHLEKVDEGSARPLLAWMAAGLLMNAPGHARYFEEARDLVAECVRAVSDAKPLPEAFPKEMLPYFNEIGRSLRDGETVDLAAQGARDPAVLTQERRKRLVLAASSNYQKEVELAGHVEEIDWGKRSFRLRMPSGDAVSVPFSSEHEERVREAGGRPRTMVSLRGVGLFDAFEKLQRLEPSQHPQLDFSPNHELAAALERIGELKDGWYEGKGFAPEPAALDAFSELLLGTFPAQLPLPFACATPEGTVFLEWTAGDRTVSAEANFKTSRIELQSVNTVSGATENETTAADKPGLIQAYAWVRARIC